MLELWWQRRGWVFLYLHSASIWFAVACLIPMMGFLMGSCELGSGLMFWLCCVSSVCYVALSPIALVIACKKDCYESKVVAAYPLFVRASRHALLRGRCSVPPPLVAGRPGYFRIFNRWWHSDFLPKRHSLRGYRQDHR
jgi:hypothetical protein